MKKHFHTYKKLISLLPLFLLGFISSMQAQEEQFEFKLQYLEEGNDSLWGVYVRPMSGFAAGSNDAVVGSGQITVLMKNNGLDSITNIQSVNGTWNSFYDVVKGPTEATGISYLFIGLSDGDGINLEDGEETLLLTFQVPGECPDSLGLINNEFDPYNEMIYNNTGNNSDNSNPGMDLSTFNSSTGRVYNWLGNYNTLAFSCDDCDDDGIADGIEDTNGDGDYDVGIDTSGICDVCDPNGINFYTATLIGGDTLTQCGASGEDSIALMVDITGGWSPFIVTLEETNNRTGATETLIFTDYEVGDRIYVSPDSTADYRIVTITDSPPTNDQGILLCTIDSDSLFDTITVVVEGPLDFENMSDAHPADYTACNLDTLFFDVDAINGGDGVIMYQWQVSTDSTDVNLWRDIENGTPYAFATTDSLIISNPLGLDGLFYRAKVFTPFCDTLYSYAAELGVDGPFIIDTEAVDASLCALEDEIYFFTETSVGQGNFNRRWQVSQDTGQTWMDVVDDAIHDITTATVPGGPGIESIYHDTLYIRLPTANMNKWQYRIAAVGDNINACTEIYTDEATLTVEGEINIVPGFQPIDVEICSDTTACFGVVVSNAASQGEVLYQWYVLERGLADTPSNWAVVSNDGTYSGARSDTLCVTNPIGRDSFQYRVEIQTTHCAIKTSTSATLNVDGPIVFDVNAIDVTVCAGEDRNDFAFRTLMGQGVLNRRWQVNRNDGNDWVDLANIGVDTFTVGIDSVTTGLPSGFEKAYLDTLHIDTAAFYMDQWQFRLAVIGANENNCSDVYSDEATLTVEGKLSVDVQPVDVQICSDTTACFGVTIGSESNSGLIEYQWYGLARGLDANNPANWETLTNDGTYSGVRADTLCVTNVIGRDSFTYRVGIKTGFCDTITSGHATLRIDGPIRFDTNADDVTVCAKEDPNFFAYKTLMGQGLLNRRWQVSTDTGQTWNDVVYHMDSVYTAASDSSTAAIDLDPGFEKAYFDTLYIDTAAAYMNQWQYRLAAIGFNSNNCADSYAREATLTVEGQISIDPMFQPMDVALCSDTAACFGVQIINVANQGIVQYQWEKLDKGGSTWEALSSSDGRYAGVRSDTMCVLFIAGQDSTRYRVRINTGLCGDVLSEEALLEVDGPIEHIVNPQDETICAVEDSIYFTSATSIGQGQMLTRWEESRDTGRTWNLVDLISVGTIYSEGRGIEGDPSTGDMADSIYYDTLYISDVVFTMDHWQYRNVASGITGNGCNDVPSDAATLTVEGLIDIVMDPIDVNICSDTAACFGVTVSNETMKGNINYQWQTLRPGTTNWISLTSSDGRYGGVRSDTLCVNNVAGLDSFAYRVYIFTDQCANVYSDSAVLNVSGPIDFEVQPQDVAVCAAEDETFFNAKTTIGEGGLTTRWQVNKGMSWEDVDLVADAAIYNRNSSKEANALASIDSTYYDTLFLNAVATAGMDQWQYRIVANGLNGVSCQDINSDAAILTVNGPLNVARNPRDTTVCSGQPALFEVRSSNDASGVIRYQWQRKVSSGAWVDLGVNEIYNGVRDSILSISDVAKVVAGVSGVDSAFYRAALYTDECDRIFSDSAQLRVEGPFEFATDADSPHDTVVCAGEPIIFNANPRNDGFGTMLFDWKVSVDGVNYLSVGSLVGYMGMITGANTTQLILDPMVSDHVLLDSTFWRLDITSAACADETNSLRALLRVDGDIIFDLQPQDTTNCADKGVIFYANVTNNGYTGQDGLRYQWQELEHNGSGIWENVQNAGVYNGASTDTLSIDITTGLDSNQYRMITWTSVCNQDTSDAAYLIEEGSTSFTDHPEDVIICSGEMTSFAARVVNSTGQGVNIMNWQISTNNGISWRNIDPMSEALFSVNGAGPTATMDTTATAMSDTLFVSDVEGMQGYRFRAAVTSTYCDTVFSQLAKLTVEGPFSATLTGPATVCANIGVSIEAEVVNEGAGLPDLTWQWRAPGGTFSNISETWDIFNGEKTNGIGLKVLRIDSVLNENSRENLPAGVDTFYNFDQYEFRLSIVSDTCKVAVFSDTFLLNVVADTIGGCDWDLDGMTNTVDLDDDNDGLTDSVEHYITTYAGSEPQDSVAQFDTDTDNNSVTDNEEDADEDTISNGEEVDDDDGDGLSDGVDSLTGVFTGFPAMPDPTDEDPDDIFNGDPLDPCDPILSPSCIGVVLDLNVKLQGAMPILGFDETDAVLMNDDLRRKGLLPRVSPYEDFFVLDSLNTVVPAFVHVKRDSVLEEISMTDSTKVFGLKGFKEDTTANAVVDWVFVEIRDGSKLDSIVTTRAALLQRDGDIRDHRVFDDPRKMDADGYAYLSFDSTLAGDYYVSVRHRNHLGAMTNNAGLFSPIVTRVDFSDKDFNALGIHSERMNGDSTEQYLWAGDVTSDRKIIYQGPGNDVDEMFFRVIAEPNNTDLLDNYIVPGYYRTDYNMDGNSIFQGPKNDRQYLIFQSILQFPDNQVKKLANYVILEQLP